jgi:hypothetical protein
VRNYIERFPDVAEAVKHQKEGMLDVAEGKLYSAINKGEAWAICFFLKTQGKARKYSERLEVTGQDGGPIKQEQTINWANVPDVELEAAVKEVERLLLK